MIKDSIGVRKISFLLALLVGFTGHYLEHHRQLHVLQVGQLIEQAEIILTRREALKKFSILKFTSCFHSQQKISFVG